MRIIVVVGARPNFIKIGPLMPAFAEAGIDARIAHYYPQVALYAQTVQGRLPGGGRLATYGLWFVREGRVVRWAVA